MKRFRITTTIEAENEYDANLIAQQIDRDLNRGDGLYMRLPDRDKGCEIVEIKRRRSPDSAPSPLPRRQNAR